MAAGDVTEAGPYTLPLSSAAKTAIKALRNSANDNWLLAPSSNGQQVFVINIEEA